MTRSARLQGKDNVTTKQGVHEPKQGRRSNTAQRKRHPVPSGTGCHNERYAHIQSHLSEQGILDDATHLPYAADIQVVIEDEDVGILAT